MFDSHLALGPLRVGVPIPTEHPTAGGGYEFQQTVFEEILKRIAAPPPEQNQLQWIPIATDPSSSQRWGMDPSRVLHLQPTQGLRIRSALHRRMYRVMKPWNPLPLSKTLAVREQIRILRQHVDVLWSLNFSSISDQLPYVITVWDLQHRLQPFFPEVSKGDGWETRESHYARFARKSFLCVTGTLRGSDELRQFFGIDSSRILVSPFPCPKPLATIPKDQHDLLQELGLERGGFLLYPAQFWPHKNHISALLALRQLHDQGYGLKLVFTGADKGSLAAVRGIVSELKLNDSVVFAGFVERARLAALYSTALALIFPSFFGPDNIPPLEAMSYGLPALVADVPGSREQYGDSVLFFDPSVPDQLSQAVLQLIHDQDLRFRLTENGRKLLNWLTPTIYVDRMQAYLLKAYLPLRCSTLSG